MRKAVTAVLSTPEARKRLSVQHAPYWREVLRGRALGYRKGPRKAEWYLREWRGGRYVKRTLGQADDAVKADGTSVLSWEQALTVALGTDAEALPTRRSGQTVKDVAKAYFEHRAAKSRSAESIALDKGKLTAAVLPDWGDTPVVDVTTKDLRGWLDDQVTTAMLGHDKDDEADRRERQRRAQNTANRIWTVFRAVLNFAHAHGYVDSDAAWRRVKPYRDVDQPRDRFLSLAECRRLLNACRADFRLIVRGALLTGLRYGELCRLKVADFDGKTIIVTVSKAGGSRRVPLSKEGMEFFTDQIAGRTGDALIFTRADGDAWGSHDQARRMSDACKAAKVLPVATFHDLRRTYGSQLVNSGMPMASIQKLLGHADQRMTERVYAHMHEDVLRKALQEHLPRFESKKTKRSNVRSIDSARKAER